MVPVFAKGFEDLKKRVDEQDAAIKGVSSKRHFVHLPL
jgi:hypothetical protein